MKVGVIGRGFGAGVVAPAFESTEGCEVVAVVSPRDDAAVAALCARADVDLVSVHSPPFMHLDHVRRALEGGHAVLCDKPFGRNRAEAREMLDAAERSGAVHLVNFEMRCDPVRLALRDLLRSGAIGRPEHVQSTTFLAVSRSPLRRYGWLFDAELGGGWVGAWASHLIDFLRWSLGEIDGVTAELRTVITARPDADGAMHPCTAEDGFTASLRIAEGVTVCVDSSFAAPVTVPPRLTVVGSDGVVEVVGEQRITLTTPTGTEEVPCGGAGGGLGGAMGGFALQVRDAVAAGRPAEGMPTFADGLACRQVLDRIVGA